MPKRVKQTKKRTPRQLPEDVNERAAALVALTTDTEPAPAISTELRAYMAQLGRRGGKIGGKLRLVKMTQAARREVAIKGARARWDKAKKPTE
jgi:hypothetical protein